MEFTAVVFDMDGVLIDSERIIRDGWIGAAEALGHTLPESLFARVVGASGAESERILREELGADFPLRDVFAHARELIDARTADGWPAKPHARELLAQLEALGVPIAVASSTRRLAVEARLESAGLRSHVRALCAGDEVAVGKPHPEIYERAAQRIEVDPRRCIAVEDSMHGVRAAHGAGMRTVLVPDLVAPPDPLPEVVQHRFTSLLETRPHLLAWLGHGD